MRIPHPPRLAAALLLVSVSLLPLAAAPEKAPARHGLTVEEEARILALEDRRQFDPGLVATWVAHKNPLHRLRIAQALGRIGPHAFIDRNQNNQRDDGEVHAGVAELRTLTNDKDPDVRRAATFALGEIGDSTALSTVTYLLSDGDPAVAAEAVEAVSKYAASDRFFRGHGLGRYIWALNEKMPEAVRARALRYLFRFDSNDAGEAAAAGLSSPSPLLRQEAAYSLSRLAYPPARDQLHLLLSDPNVLTRVYSAAALGRIASSDSAPRLVAALGDIHPWVRTNAAVALSKIAEKDRKVLKSDDLPRIFAAAEDPDPGVRASMIDVVAQYATADAAARARLTEIFSNGTQWERELAAGAIAKHFTPQSEPFVLLSGQLTPWQAVRVIEGSATRPHGQSIRAKYATHGEAMVRATAISSIPDERVNVEFAAITRAFDDADPVVRAAAYERYGLAAMERPQQRFQRLDAAEKKERTAPMNDARIAAIQAMAKIDNKSIGRYLTNFITDTDPVVRRIASDAIVKEFRGVPQQYGPLPSTRTPAQYAEIVRWSRKPHTATIHMARGKVELALLTQDAPMTTWNFAQLAKKKFFDGTTFMRVVPNFVVQGGDPRNDMNGGPGYAIRDEINEQRYTRGAVGMALSGPDTGGSQFFIAHSPQPHLDGGYTVFARVYDGMAGVVDQIERGDRVTTITIDEHAPVGATEVSALPAVALPLLVGEMPAARMLEQMPGYTAARDAYRADAAVVEMLADALQPGDRIEAYVGTWCVDSEREVPRLLRIVGDLETAHQKALPVRMIAVDRSRQQPQSLVAGKSLAKVPTFVLYRGDQELGRIEERPVGLLEDALLAIAARAPKP